MKTEFYIKDRKVVVNGREFNILEDEKSGKEYFIFKNPYIEIGTDPFYSNREDIALSVVLEGLADTLLEHRGMEITTYKNLPVIFLDREFGEKQRELFLAKNKNCSTIFRILYSTSSYAGFVLSKKDKYPEKHYLELQTFQEGKGWINQNKENIFYRAFKFEVFAVVKSLVV